jgi:hypothetical protein
MRPATPGARWATTAYVLVAVATNLIYAALCTRPDLYVLAALVVGLILVIPLNFTVGGTWAEVAAGSRRWAWLVVVLVALLPILTIWTLWPLRLSCLIAGPALERMADEAVAGRSFSGPAKAGPFEIHAAMIHADGRRVDLLTETNPNHPAGFVRLARDAPEGYISGAVAGSDLNIQVFGPWSFRQDD